MFVLQLSPIWLCFLACYALFRGMASRNLISGDRRVSWAFTVLLTGFLFVAIPEIASAARRLTPGTVLALWLAVDAALLSAAAGVWFYRPWKRPPHWVARASRPLRPASRRTLPSVSQPPSWNAAMLALVSFFVLAVGAVALWCPTTSWDSLTYHMPRVMHWIQQRSLAHYPTNIMRQVESAPGAELQITSLVLLTGGDLAVNLPQWLAMLTCAVVASFAAERLAAWHFGKDQLAAEKARWCGLLAALVVVTLPAGVVQAISTQNDFLSAQWALLLAAFCLLVAREPGNRFYIAAVAAAFALGVANKPTMFIYAAPFLAALGFWLMRKHWRRLALLVTATAVLTLAVNAPWMARNCAVFHDPLGSQDTRDKEALVDHAPAKITANVLRNAALYAGTPFDWTTGAMNRFLAAGFEFTCEYPQDAGSVWLDQTFTFPVRSSVKNGDGFGGCMASLPVLLAALFFAVKFKWRSPLLIYAGLIFAGFVLFCGLLKWQPWHQRLHLPFFVLAAPCVGVVLGMAWNRWATATAAILLTVNAALVLFYNHAFPIYRMGADPFKTREERYFCEIPQLHAFTAALARDIVGNGVTNVCLKTGGDTWEYPLWVCLKNRGFKGTIRHAFVENETRLSSPPPDLENAVILSADAGLTPPPGFGRSVAYGNWTVNFK